MVDAPVAEPDTRYALVYDESLRALREQQEALKDVRTHAGQLLAAGSVAASFLGGLVVRAAGRPPAWAAVAALVAGIAFLALVAICVWIVVPRRGWVFVSSATLLIEEYVEATDSASVDTMRRDLALWMEEHWDENARALEERLLGIQVAAGLLGVALTAWCVALMGR